MKNYCFKKEISRSCEMIMIRYRLEKYLCVKIYLYIISTVVRSGYRRVVCHDVVSLVIYYLHGREVGLPTDGMPQCREFGYILFPRS